MNGEKRMKLAVLFSLLMIHRVFSFQTWSGLTSPNAARRTRVRVSVPRRRLSTRRSNIVMMPEGPEVRTLVDQLQPAVGMRLVDFNFLSGRYVQHGRPKGFEEFAKTMTPWISKKAEAEEEGVRGVKTDIITALSCKGKFIYLVMDQESGTNGEHDDDFRRSIWVTLGMTGQFVNEEEIEKPKPVASNSHRARSGPRWCMKLVDTKTNQSRKIYYKDERNFGTLKFCLSAKELDDKLDSLGPDLLDFENTTEEVFLAAMERSTQKRNVCKYLMDQSKIAGVGNYILAEGLYRAKLDPFAELSELNTGQRKRLFRELREIAHTSYSAQGLTRPDGGTYRRLDGSRGEFEFHLQCYGQQLSPNKYPVTKEVNGPHGRTIWYVAEEQLFMPRSQRDLNYNESYNNEDTVIGDTADSIGEPSYNVSEIPNQLADTSWKYALSEHMSSASFQFLLSKIQSDANAGATIYPPVQDVFSALNLCPLDEVKCVIVGQDPYHQPGQGHGLAFSVRKGVKPPPSLVNIFKEAMEDVGIEPPKHGNLEGWAKQGVLLMTSVLTVRQGQANSHARLGWEEFTDEIINTINKEKDAVVFMLWGGPAAKKAKHVDECKHTVIRTSHPSPLGATKTASPFLSSQCFSRVNDALVAAGHSPIDWNLK